MNIIIASLIIEVWDHGTSVTNDVFTITAEIPARSLANFHCQ